MSISFWIPNGFVCSATAESLRLREWYWVLNCVIDLEVEELVPPGTAHWFGFLVGLSAERVAQAVGPKWIPANTK